jgi:hypothetical protein
VNECDGSAEARDVLTGHLLTPATDVKGCPPFDSRRCAAALIILPSVA